VVIIKTPHSPPQLLKRYLLTILDSYEYDTTDRVTLDYSGHKTEEGRPLDHFDVSPGVVITFQSGAYWVVCQILKRVVFPSLFAMVDAKGSHLIPWGTYATRVEDHDSIYLGRRYEEWGSYRLKVFEYKLRDSL
jgi:hypothetical protein